MFELPEYVTLARQINETLTGKVIWMGCLGNSSHKFVWYNRAPDEFEALTHGKTVGVAHARGKWLFVPLEPGYVLVLGECGGRVLYHEPGARGPLKYHLRLEFTDGSALTATTQMWGAMELYEQGREGQRRYIRDMRPTPTEADFTPEYLGKLIRELVLSEKRSVKGLLTQDQLVPGVGNAIAQDILFRAALHPKHCLDDLRQPEVRRLHGAIVKTIGEAIQGGGRYDEFDLFNHPGGYVRVMDKNSAARPCLKCGTKIEKIAYMGGTCYLCPSCQK